MSTYRCHSFSVPQKLLSLFDDSRETTPYHLFEVVQPSGFPQVHRTSSKHGQDNGCRQCTSQTLPAADCESLTLSLLIHILEVLSWDEDTAPPEGELVAWVHCDVHPGLGIKSPVRAARSPHKLAELFLHPVAVVLCSLGLDIDDVGLG
jgi:hypothetical protein